MDNKNILEDSKAELPTNEELVDSLVKGIKDVCTEDEISNSQNTRKLNKNGHLIEDRDCFTSENEELFEEKEETKEVNGEGESKDKKSDDDDFIDEDYLKDLEVNYSEEEKEKLKQEAEDLKNEGNSLFKAGEFKEAAITYTKALRICPLAYSKNRAVLYANRGAAKVKLFLSESAIEDCTKAVELDPLYLKVYIRRAQLYEDTEKLDESLEDYKKILELDPLHRDALFASKRLGEKINERNEKLKTEMLGKLKDLGNMFLKPFGLSTNNFQMVQDPNTGGYSINFTQKPNHS